LKIQCTHNKAKKRHNEKLKKVKCSREDFVVGRWEGGEVGRWKRAKVKEKNNTLKFIGRSYQPD
jgi:hypothetical protein